MRTTCPYCGVGCGIVASARRDGDVEICGDSGHPANGGRLCAKGLALGETIGLETRLLTPQIGGEPASWDAALDLVASKFLEAVRKYGPDSVGFYVSGQLLTEDYYVANKLMKGFIGSGNIDTNSRLCMSSAVAGHKRAFGADAVPGCYADVELADLVVFVGSNTAWCHPVLYQRVLKARAERGVKIVVIDPRRTATCEEADLHLAIRAGTDVRLFNALLLQLSRRGALDLAFVEQHTAQYEETLARAAADDCSAQAVAAHCEVETRDVETFFAWFAATARTVTAFSQGVNQSTRGADKVNAIVNCHLATGRIGKPGATPFSITGQPNAMGGREVGGLANQLAAHMDFGPEENVSRLQRFWNSRNVARRPGLMAVDMFRAAGDDRLRALWIMATNPAASLPDAGRVREALGACDFVVVSDCVAQTDTAKFAHVLLPAAAWGEKDGTVTNSERCISRQRAFLDVPGEARPDWWMIAEVARRMGFAREFPYRAPAEIFREHAALSAFENTGTRAFDIGGLTELSDAQYDALKPVQWPVPVKSRTGPQRLFADGQFFTPDKRARFIAVAAQAPAQSLSARYPLILNTGRVRDHWHTMTRTGLSARLSSHRPEPCVEIHPDDAAHAGIADGDLARVATAWGSTVLRASCVGSQKRGALFVPIHWTATNAASALAGSMVNPFVDAISGQPEFKHTPVRLDPFIQTWRGFLLTRTEIAPLAIAYWAKRRVRGGLLYELAGGVGDQMPGFDVFGNAGQGGERVEIVNDKQCDYRLARIVDGRLTHCLILTRSGSLPPREWLSSLLDGIALTLADRVTLLAGRPAGGGGDEGPLVCACFGVSRTRIARTVRDEKLVSVEAIGAVLGAGTNCGSCRAELRGILETEALRA
ncbi:MAG: molybdopterin-dependent oxidoreductase [Proteobacteria bacterium]|nr:molybdopterin-dependent oxidoreductase [Pseudomonadota bacterium]